MIAIINALRSLAATDEICKEISESHGIQECLKLWSIMSLTPSVNESNLVLTIAQALKQFAQNDDIKREIINHYGDSLILNFLNKYIQQNNDIIKSLLSLITTITLRQPNLAMSFVKKGCTEILIQIIKLHKNEFEVLSHACKCIRNLCVRNEEIKKIFLKTELEELVRDVKRRHCKDDASAALRDMGLDDY